MVTTQPDFTNSKAGDCTESFTLEFYDTLVGAWYTASVGTPGFVSAIGTIGDFDMFLDGVDASSISYRPETSFDARITVTLPDSVMTVG